LGARGEGIQTATVDADRFQISEEDDGAKGGRRGERGMTKGKKSDPLFLVVIREENIL